MINCRGYLSGNPYSGYDNTCEYEEADKIDCDCCVCNGGRMNPLTGKKMNWFRWWVFYDLNSEFYKQETSRYIRFTIKIRYFIVCLFRGKL